MTTAPEKIYLTIGSSGALMEDWDVVGNEKDVEYILSSLTARWVSVKERLPEENVTVPVVVKARKGDFLLDADERQHGEWYRWNPRQFEGEVVFWLDEVPPIPEEK